MPYLQHLSNHNNNNDDDHSSRNISPPNHETLEDSKSDLSAASSHIHNPQFYHHEHEHEKYGLQWWQEIFADS